MTKVKFMRERRYDLDWLRVLAIILVLFYHVGMFYNSWGYHIKNPITSKSFEPIMIWLHQWRMPLLLFISGAATIYASSKRGTGQIIRERSRRLLIPLIVSMFVIVPPQIYFERISQFAGYFDFYKTVFELQPYPEGGSFSWHHMWFVLYLFLYSIIFIPLLRYLKSENSISLISRLEKIADSGWFIPGFALIIIITQIILRPIFPVETHALINDWAYFVQYGCFYFAGLLFASSDKIWEVIEKRRRYHLLLGVISLCFMWALYFFIWDWLSGFLSQETINVIWEMNLIFLGWTWVIAILGYGKKYLNRESKIISKSNEGIYPFYILHQTAIIAVAFYYSKFDSNIFSGFLVVSVLSGLISAGIYWFLIRPFNLCRFLFGMKMKKKLILSGETKTDIETEKVRV